MREAIKVSGEEWKEKFSDMPRRLFEVPGGSSGGRLGMVFLDGWEVDVIDGMGED